MEDDADQIAGHMAPHALKSTTVREIHKVKVAIFRISDHNMNALFGTPMLPILNPREELAQKPLQQAHTTQKNIEP